MLLWTQVEKNLYFINGRGGAMYYSTYYHSPIGKLLIVTNEQALVGLWYEDQKYKDNMMPNNLVETKGHPIIKAAIKWLDEYFNGQEPDISRLPLSPMGGEFRQQVWDVLTTIPYGEIITYKEIAKEVAERLGRENMSAQAVGGAVGHNPLCIIIPCHRVIGSNGSLTGYSGGIDKKITLLEHEGVDLTTFSIPEVGRHPSEKKELL